LPLDPGWAFLAGKAAWRTASSDVVRSKLLIPLEKTVNRIGRILQQNTDVTANEVEIKALKIRWLQLPKSYQDGQEVKKGRTLYGNRPKQISAHFSRLKLRPKCEGQFVTIEKDYDRYTEIGWQIAIAKANPRIMHKRKCWKWPKRSRSSAKCQYESAATDYTLFSAVVAPFDEQ